MKKFPQRFYRAIPLFLILLSLSIQACKTAGPIQTVIIPEADAVKYSSTGPGLLFIFKDEAARDAAAAVFTAEKIGALIFIKTAAFDQLVGPNLIANYIKALAMATRYKTMYEECARKK